MTSSHPLHLKSDSATGSRQRYLGRRGLIALIAFLSAFAPLSTDLYLPALPGMARYFGVSANLTNLTLILFFIFFSAGTLFWGPLSDKYGRRPVLLSGMVLYSVSSLSCAIAPEIYSLIASRIVQAVGASAAFAVATAMVKDVYSGRNREYVLAAVQSMVLIAPVVGPLAGALLLSITTWRGVFMAQAVIGLIALLGSFALEETLARRYDGTLLQVILRLGRVLRNPGFASLLVVFSLVGMASLAYVAASSYIYQDEFGQSVQVYSYYFALNAIGLVTGPILYIRLSRRFDRRSIITAGFAAIASSGLLICTFGNLTPWLFAALLLPATIAGSCVRPPGTNMMLEQQQGDTGSAAALMSCFGILMGSAGMTIVSFNWGDTVLALGALNLAIGLLCEALWIFLSGKPFIKQIQDTSTTATSR